MVWLVRYYFHEMQITSRCYPNSKWTWTLGQVEYSQTGIWPQLPKQPNGVMSGLPGVAWPRDPGHASSAPHANSGSVWKFIFHFGPCSLICLFTLLVTACISEIPQPFFLFASFPVWVWDSGKYFSQHLPAPRCSSDVEPLVHTHDCWVSKTLKEQF